jgi:carbon-monoxide dehydrogenase medium subunit
VVNEKGVRIINLENFFTGSGQTVLMAEDLLQEIQVPDMPAGGRGCYIKLSPRQSMDLAVVGVAVMVVADRGICRDIRIALGAVSPTPIRAKKAEMLLRGRPLTIEAIKQAAGLAVEDCKPISDHRASAEYRKEMVAVLTARAIEQAIAG